MRTTIVSFSNSFYTKRVSTECNNRCIHHLLIEWCVDSTKKKSVWTKKRETDRDERARKGKGQEGCATKNYTKRDDDFLRQLDWRRELQRERGGGGRIEGYRIQILDEGGNGRRSCSGRPCYVICHVVYVSFPFHFQSLGRVQEPETPDLSRGQREQRHTHLPLPYSLPIWIRCWGEID